MKLEQAVKAACERMQATGIEGWGLRVPDELGGEVFEVGPALGCTSDTCGHNSHDAAAPTYKWVPPAGSTLVKVAHCHPAGETLIGYYVLRTEKQDLGLEVRSPRNFHASIAVEDIDEMPAWVLARLAEEDR